MGDDFTRRWRWANPAFLYSTFSPGWYKRREIATLASNDNHLEEPPPLSPCRANRSERSERGAHRRADKRA